MTRGALKRVFWATEFFFYTLHSCLHRLVKRHRGCESRKLQSDNFYKRKIFELLKMLIIIHIDVIQLKLVLLLEKFGSNCLVFTSALQQNSSL